MATGLEKEFDPISFGGNILQPSEKAQKEQEDRMFYLQVIDFLCAENLLTVDDRNHPFVQDRIPLDRVVRGYQDIDYQVLAQYDCIQTYQKFIEIFSDEGYKFPSKDQQDCECSPFSKRTEIAQKKSGRPVIRGIGRYSSQN
jgi:hypothetical protein